VIENIDLFFVYISNIPQKLQRGDRKWANYIKKDASTPLSRGGGVSSLLIKNEILWIVLKGYA